MEFPTAPGYDGRPVILQHLVLDDSPDVAFCAPVKVIPIQSVPAGVQVILCPACHAASIQRKVTVIQGR